MTTPNIILSFPDMGYVWVARWDADLCCYEVFSDRDCQTWIGNANTIGEARQIARFDASDLMA